MAQFIDQINANHGNSDKNLPINENTSVTNIIDCKSSEIRFDGCCRVISLSDRKMLILTDKGTS